LCRSTTITLDPPFKGLIVPGMSRHRAVRNLDLDGINWPVSVQTHVSADYLDDSYDEQVQGCPLAESKR